jgi:ribonuclease BN (tRNA processing enzyme)
MKLAFSPCAVLLAMLSAATLPALGQGMRMGPRRQLGPAPQVALSPASSEHSVFVVFLGTGMPRPDPTRQGPSLAVVVNGQAYIVDAGTGIVRQATAAYKRGVAALQPNLLDIAFLTHLHSDHTLGLPDLILTPWVMGRVRPLTLYGPSGTKGMVNGIEQAYSEDIDLRIHGLEHDSPTGHQVDVHEIHPGVIYQDSNVKVTAFAVKHGSWKEALGYRFDADGKSIVISGDTRPTDSVVQACDGCDILIHEAYTSIAGGQEYFSSFHTSAQELGAVAAAAKPKLLIVTHFMGGPNPDPAELIQGIQQKFHGPITVANDLDVIAP